eukprot:1689106-Prymnesium_polylepis.1
MGSVLRGGRRGAPFAAASPRTARGHRQPPRRAAAARAAQARRRLNGAATVMHLRRGATLRAHTAPRTHGRVHASARPSQKRSARHERHPNPKRAGAPLGQVRARGVGYRELRSAARRERRLRTAALWSRPWVESRGVRAPPLTGLRTAPSSPAPAPRSSRDVAPGLWRGSASCGASCNGRAG